MDGGQLQDQGQNLERGSRVNNPGPYTLHLSNMRKRERERKKHESGACKQTEVGGTAEEIALL